MPIEWPSRAKRWLPPIAVALAIFAAAPALGSIRDLLMAWSPERFLGILAAGFGLTVAATMLVALARIARRREGFGWRLAALGAALGLAGLLLALFGTGQPQVDAVERAHLLAYALLAFAFVRALGPGAGRRALLLAWLWTAVVAVLDEWLQWLVPLRVGEARDILLNLASALPGLLLALALLDRVPVAASRGTVGGRALPAALGALLLASAGFLDSAHLGHRIVDPEAGAFLSYFAPDDLAAARADRERRWRERPPTKPSPWGREDYFLTEGTWRVASRNAALERGDVATAWLENRILERHYDPVLDVRSFRSGEPHRLPPAQRAELEAGRPRGGTGSYSSPVLANRIWTTPRPATLWSVTLGLVALLAAGTWARGRPSGSERAS